MLSKKNTKLAVQNQECKQRFSIRKLSVGVASVLLGLFFLSANTAQAAENTEATEPTATVVESKEDSVKEQQKDVAVDGEQEATTTGNNSKENTSTNTKVDKSQDATTTPKKDENGVKIVGKITEDSELKNKINDKEHNDPIQGVDLDSLNYKQLVALFHIFANDVTLNAHTNGNVAAGSLGGSANFGDSLSQDDLNGNKYNLTEGDIYYIKNIKGRKDGCDGSLQPSSFGNRHFDHVVFGQDVEVQTRGDEVWIKNKETNDFYRLDHLKADDVHKEADGTNYIDFEKIFKKLSDDAKIIAGKDESKSVVDKNFSGQNNRYIKVSADSSNVETKENVIYVDVPYEYLTQPQQISIYGISNKIDGPTIVLNVKGIPADINPTFQTKIWLYYDGQDKIVSSSQKHDLPNHILWNFGTSDATITIQGAPFMGSILAPNATIIANGNIDGNIIANVVNVKSG